MASSESHHQTVVPEILATRPRSITSPLTEGGKGRGSARAWSILQPLQTLLVESLAPLTDRLGCGVKPPGDLLVGGPFCGQKHDLCAHHLPVRGGVGAGSLAQDGALVFGGFDAEWTLAGHLSSPFSATRHPPRPYCERRTHQRSSVKDHLAARLSMLVYASFHLLETLRQVRLKIRASC